jgi:hypothetical protein
MNQGGPANCRAFLLQVSYKTPFISFWHGAMPNRHRAKPGREPWPLFPSSLPPVSGPLGRGPWTLGRVPGGQVPGPGRVPGGHAARYLVARSLVPGPRYLGRATWCACLCLCTRRGRVCGQDHKPRSAGRATWCAVPGPWSLVPGGQAGAMVHAARAGGQWPLGTGPDARAGDPEPGAEKTGPCLAYARLGPVSHNQ